MTEYTREQLIAITDKAVVPMSKWRDRDSADAQLQMALAAVLLHAGAPFKVITEGKPHGCVTDARTIWVEITWHGFGYFEDGEGSENKDTFYLPTEARLAESAGGDWY